MAATGTTSGLPPAAATTAAHQRRQSAPQSFLCLQAGSLAEDGGAAAAPSALLPCGGLPGGFVGVPSHGRVPNFPPHYLSALNGAGSLFEGHPPTSQTGEAASPASAAKQHQQSLTPMSVEGPFMSGATIVTNNISSSSAPTSSASTATPAPPPPQVVITASKKSGTGTGGSSGGGGGGGRPKSSHRKDRRHSMPTSIVLSPSAMRGMKGGSSAPPTHPVPEFLCHLYSMLCDPALSALIGWVVPAHDEPNDMGGGRAGVGKIVVRDPTSLQEEVLGKYYRHSKYSSFQRQLNYFGFKKRLHGSKKGKMCPCSFVHDTLGIDPQSLLNLKRRPPSSKRVESSSSLGSRAKPPGEKKRRPKKDRVRGGGVGGLESSSEVPTDTDLHGVVVVAAESGSSPTYVSPTTGAADPSPTVSENEPWGVGVHRRSQGAGAVRVAVHPHPLNMPIMAQAPGTAWTTPSHFVTRDLANSTIPMFVGGTKRSALKPVDVANDASDSGNSTSVSDGISALRANNSAAVLEARKTLERNFLKSQRERPLDAPASSLPRQPRLCSASQRFDVADQQKATMKPPALGHAAPYLHKATDNGNARAFVLPAEPLTVPPGLAPATGEWAGRLGAECAGPSPLAASCLPPAGSSTTGGDFFVPMPRECGTLGFPAKAEPPPAVGADVAGGEGPRTTAFLWAGHEGLCRPWEVATVTSSEPTTSMSSQGISETPPTHFDGLLSNLLSTALPPSEELFNDDMSAGSFSDFGTGALQVADDGGMLLP